MMTLEDIRNVQFSKGRGYRADEVDDFIDECVAAMERLKQEANEANQKVKTLADKLAEYRNDEDAIRAALLNAQRTADTVVREAEEKAAKLLSDAQQNADAVRQELVAEAKKETEELARVKQEVAAFKKSLFTMYKEHLSVLGLLPDELEQPETAEAAPAEPTEQPQPASETEETPAEVPAEEAVVVAPAAEEPTAEQPQEELKPLSRYADLKFGNDYDIHNDPDDEDDKPSRGLFRKKK